MRPALKLGMLKPHGAKIRFFVYHTVRFAHGAAAAWDENGIGSEKYVEPGPSELLLQVFS